MFHAANVLCYRISKSMKNNKRKNTNFIPCTSISHMYVSIGIYVEVNLSHSQLENSIRLKTSKKYIQRA